MVVVCRRGVSSSVFPSISCPWMHLQEKAMFKVSAKEIQGLLDSKLLSHKSRFAQSGCSTHPVLQCHWTISLPWPVTFLRIHS